MEQFPRVKSFEDMKVWQEAHQLAMRVMEQTPNLPSEQQDGLALRMENAAVDVPRYIAEGFKRRGSRNKAHFYDVARSTLEGLRYYFILCRDLKFEINFDDLSYRGDQVSRMLDGLVRSMSRHGRDRGGRRGGGRDRMDEPDMGNEDYGDDEGDGGE
ncbi:MAG TPA: four helix bundle protein, partial [Tepidisphaeraceae bacterium]|nr:four helix bundle protein [Tepidisphaeraceae bacterium]